MKAIIQLLLREIQKIGKDHSLLLVLMIAPVLYAFFYGSIYQYKEEEKVPLAIVDDDKTPLSQTLIDQIKKLQIADVYVVSNLEDAQNAMNQGDCVGYLYIENGLQKKMQQFKQANTVLALNSSKFLPSNDLAGGVTKVVLTVGAGVRLKYFNAKGLVTDVAMPEINPITADYKPLHNERSSYGQFLLPGLIALILQQTLLLGLTTSIVGDKKENEEIMKITDNPANYLAGLGSVYFFLFMLYAVFFFTINFSLLEIPVKGSFLQLLLITAFFIMTVIPFGVVIGTLFKSKLIGMQIMAFSTYPIFLVTGYTWPFSSLPLILQAFSSLLPTTPFLKIYIAITQAGVSITEMPGTIIHLLILCAIYTLLAIYCINRSIFKSNKSLITN